MSNWEYFGEVNWLLGSRELHGKIIKNWCSNWRKISCTNLRGRTGTYKTTDTCSQKPPRLELPIIVYSPCTILRVMHQPNAAVRWPLFKETTAFVMQHISQSLTDWLKIKYECCYCDKYIPSVPGSRMRWTAELITGGSCRLITCVCTNLQMQVSIAPNMRKCSQNVRNAHLTQADRLTRALNEHLQNQSHLFCFILTN